jgi:O-acetyl-ADP-ribose deacetylase (regulator of RNase III)
MRSERLELIEGDITTMDVDAIVNAANSSLLGGGGVDGAIHRAAGPALREECRLLNGCNVGEAKITGGYNLKAKYIIHTVGPVWRDGLDDEHRLLASCYQNCLALAKDKSLKSIAFPGISTGAYRFPKDLAAFIAVTETKRFIAKYQYPEKVIFVTFDHQSFLIYQKLLSE